MSIAVALIIFIVAAFLLLAVALFIGWMMDYRNVHSRRFHGKGRSNGRVRKTSIKDEEWQDDW